LPNVIDEALQAWLEGIDADLGDMVAGWQRVCESPNAPEAAGTMPLAHLEQAPPSLDYAHVPPAGFKPGEPVAIEPGIRSTTASLPVSVWLHYRHARSACVTARPPPTSR